MTLLMDNNLFVARRLKLFRNINSQPTLYEIITGKASKPIKINSHPKRKRADTVSHPAYVYALICVLAADFTSCNSYTLKLHSMYLCISIAR